MVVQPATQPARWYSLQPSLQDDIACNPAFARQKQVDNENQSSWVYVASFKSAKVTERDPV